jgi:hypothetical protein
MRTMLAGAVAHLGGVRDAGAILEAGKLLGCAHALPGVLSTRSRRAP